jgi:ubiquinone/menaquinone biosynthesis C-methylase UbiE
MSQDKRKEIAFFDGHAASFEYNVFIDSANEKIVDKVESMLSLPKGSSILDIGCGSGIFGSILEARGYHLFGVDLSYRLLQIGSSKYRNIGFLVGDAEILPLRSRSFDGVMLSGIVHHLPDPSQCAAEVMRILRPGGRFVAFDPNGRNPFMYLYRAKSSPFYSSKGVTENEQPILAEVVAEVFQVAGFRVKSDFLSGLGYRYVSSKGTRLILPVYNFADRWLFRPKFMKPLSVFVFTCGQKP